jgi:MFS family permease
MQAGLIILCLAYVLSQFYRAFLAVLAVPMEQDTGAGPEVLAMASGLWFLSFAVMQLPVGWALDRIGPRRTASVLLFLGGGGGALVFALATSALHIHIAMVLIGIGCSPVLMASYYIFAREYPAARFATLAALMLGIGSAGNLLASYPTALAADLIGWRGTLGVLAVVSALVAIGIFATVRDPEPAQSDVRGSVLDLLRMPAIWLILPMMFVNYAPSAAIRGLWIGPYLSDVFGLSTSQIGQATLIMSAAMIAGTLIHGPLDRVFGTRKWLVLAGCLGSIVSLTLLVWAVSRDPVLSILLCAAIGFFGTNFPVIIAHGRSFFPPHLVGRGVTLMNLFGIGGVGIMQLATGRIHAAYGSGPPEVSYAVLFTFIAVVMTAGVLIYAFSTDRVD